MASFYTRMGDELSDDELHSDDLEEPVGRRSAPWPAALLRLIKLGFTEEEAQQILKG